MDWLILFTGFCGGAIRGLVGFIKHQFSFKDVKFDLAYFLLMIFLSGLIGLVIAHVFKQDAVFSLIIGYAGGDFVENIYKTIKKNQSIYPKE